MFTNYSIVSFPIDCDPALDCVSVDSDQSKVFVDADDLFKIPDIFPSKTVAMCEKNLIFINLFFSRLNNKIWEKNID